MRFCTERTRLLDSVGSVTLKSHEVLLTCEVRLSTSIGNILYHCLTRCMLCLVSGVICRCVWVCTCIYGCVSVCVFVYVCQYIIVWVYYTKYVCVNVFVCEFVCIVCALYNTYRLHDVLVQ